MRPVKVQDWLVPVEALRARFADIRDSVAPYKGGYSLGVNDPSAEEALIYYVLFTHCPHSLDSEEIQLDDEATFYNRYFWQRRISWLITRTRGSDAGLEQQAFQLLQSAAIDIDWELIDALQRCAQTS
jgi:hypothetical protein